MLPLLRRLDSVDPRDRLRRLLNGSEILRDQIQRLAFIEIAHDNRGRVVWVIEGVVEIFEPRGRNAFDIRAPADCRMW
jgi:hypothetical protein